MNSSPDRSLVEISSLQPFVNIFGLRPTKREFTLTAESPLRATHCLSRPRTTSSYPHRGYLATWGRHVHVHVGTFIRHVRVPWTIGGTAHHYAHPFSF